MRNLVWAALDNAFNNGYTFVLNSNPVDIAYDLIAYDADLEDSNPEELAPYIRQWQDHYDR